MKILVTGGCGYIGSHTSYALAARGHDIVILDDFSTGFRALAPSAATIVKGDIGDRALLRRLFGTHGFDAVIHFAGAIVVPESVTNPLKYYRNNTGKSFTLIEECVAAGTRHFLFSSTSVVYDDLGDAALSETDRLNPISPYGRSKMMVEMALEDTARAHDFSYGVLRYFNAAGADPGLRTGQSGPNATHLIKVACQTALGQRPHLDIYGTDYPTRDGTCIRDYIHVSDLADAHAAALDALASRRDSFVLNCGYGRGFTVREIIESVKKVSGIDFPVHVSERRAGDRPFLIANNDRIRSVLGWEPRHNELDTIIRTALQWEQKLPTLSLKADS